MWSRLPGLLPYIYSVWALPLLVAVAWLTPPWQNPDEPLHFARAVQIAHGGLLGSRAWGTAGGDSDAAIYAAYKPVQPAAMHPERRLSAQDLAASGAVGWSPRVAYTSFPNTAQYPPFFYVPDAAAYWVGRAAGLSIDHTLKLARLANAGLFTLLAGGALAMARRSRPLLLAVLCLPTTLALACSTSQDSLALGATAFAVGLLDRCVHEQRDATPWEAVVATVLLACVAMARPPYAFLLLALGLASIAPRRALVRLAAPAAAVTLAWCLLVALHVSVNLGGADMARQLAFIGAHPGAVPGILAATFAQFTGGWWVQLIGVLGWTDTVLPTPYILAASFTLGVATVASCAGTGRAQLLPAAGLVLMLAAILMLQYLAWTWPGQLVVTGVLGRYFTAPAMVLALALPALRLPSAVPAVSFVMSAALAVCTPAVMLHAISLRYYIR